MKEITWAVAGIFLLSFSTVTLATEDVELRMSWWGGNSRHQATLKALELFKQKYPNIKVKAEYTGWEGHQS
ncbi:MAG: ABC transporter substrate-binding protein, partial [Kluyvera sp.]